MGTMEMMRAQCDSIRCFDTRGILVAASRSGSLYVAFPADPGKHRVYRCRLADVDGGPAREAWLSGRIASVRAGAGDGAAGAITCGGRLFHELPGTDGQPAGGSRLAVGIEGAHAQEVSSPLTLLVRLPQERAWVATPLARAYRNGDRGWRGLLGPAEYEAGDEAISDEELTPRVLDAFYRRRLLWKARLRQEHGRRLGHDVAPRAVPVSNDELAAALGVAVAS